MNRFIKFLRRIFGKQENHEPFFFKNSNSEKLTTLSSNKKNEPQKNSSPRKILSNQELNYLLNKAETNIDSNNLKQALLDYTQIIENTMPEPHFFKRRAWINRMLGNPSGAIEDYSKAIELNPDDGTTYWEIAPCYTYNLSKLGYNENEKRKTLLGKALYNYKTAVQRIPTSPEAWLAIIETDLRLFEFDDAISNYGTCKPYINTKEYQAVRSWLGCLALTFSGEIIEKEDEKYLNDSSIRLKRNHWSLRAIDFLLLELEKQKNFDKTKLQKAKEIHLKFINKFDESPIRYES